MYAHMKLEIYISLYYYFIAYFVINVISNRIHMKIPICDFTEANY